MFFLLFHCGFIASYLSEPLFALNGTFGHILQHQSTGDMHIPKIRKKIHSNNSVQALLYADYPYLADSHPYKEVSIYSYGRLTPDTVSFL
jgi:hypothetical protein